MVYNRGNAFFFKLALFLLRFHHKVSLKVNQLKAYLSLNNFFSRHGTTTCLSNVEIETYLNKIDFEIDTYGEELLNESAFAVDQEN